MVDLLIGLCLATAAEVTQLPAWSLHVVRPELFASCATRPYPTMKALRSGALVWPR